MAWLNSKFMHHLQSSRKWTLLVGWTCCKSFWMEAAQILQQGKGCFNVKMNGAFIKKFFYSFHFILVSTCWIKWGFMKACAFTDRLVHYKHPHCQLLCGKLQYEQLELRKYHFMKNIHKMQQSLSTHAHMLTLLKQEHSVYLIQCQNENTSC